MQARVACDCGTTFIVRDADFGKRTKCPRCAKIITIPQAALRGNEGSRPIERADSLGASAAANTGIVKSPAAAPAVLQVSDGQEDDLDLELPAKSRKSKGRRRGLTRVNFGLAFHYALPFLFLGGTGAGLLATVLDVGNRIFEVERLGAPAPFFFLFCGIFFVLTALAAIVPEIFGLLGAPEKVSRGYLIMSLCLLVVSLLPAALLFLNINLHWLAFGLTFAAQFAAWAFWMAFLQNLFQALKKEQSAEEVRRTLLAGVRTMLIGIFVILGAGFLILLVIRHLFLLWFLGPSMLGATMVIIFKLGGFDSFLNFFGAPFGIPFAIEYVNFIGGLRMVILRRT